MIMNIVIIISAVSAVIAAIYAYKNYWTSKSPKIVIEIPFNNSLEIRNVGTDIAKNIKEKSNLLRDVPTELWNFTGPIDYIRIKSPGISKTANFQNNKIPKPSTSTLIRFEYENTDGDKFCSEIVIDRNQSDSQIYFNIFQPIKWRRM